MGVGGCNVGLGGDVAFQQSDVLSHHGFGLRFQYADATSPWISA